MREGLNERRATKIVTAVAEVTEPNPPFSLRLFLHGWGLIVVAVLIVGFAGALNALGNFTSSDFIAVAVPLAALLGVLAVARVPAPARAATDRATVTAPASGTGRPRLPTVAPSGSGDGYQPTHLSYMDAAFTPYGWCG